MLAVLWNICTFMTEHGTNWIGKLLHLHLRTIHGFPAHRTRDHEMKARKCTHRHQEREMPLMNVLIFFPSDNSRHLPVF